MLQGENESEGESELFAELTAPLLDRYMVILAGSKSSYVDFIPVIYHDTDDLPRSRLQRRFGVFTGEMVGRLPGGYPGLGSKDQPIRLVDPHWGNGVCRINRTYFQHHSFYNTAPYQSFFDFFLRKLSRGLSEEPELHIPVSDLNLKDRTVSTLHHNNVHTIEDLVYTSPRQLISMRYVREKTYTEVLNGLDNHGISHQFPAKPPRK